MHISAETLVIANFIFPPTFLQPSHSDEADAARMLAFALIGFVDGPFKRLIVGSERFFQSTEMLKSIAKIMIWAREAGIESDRFLIKDETFLSASHFGQHGCERIPKNSFGRHARECAAQCFDSDCLLAHVALNATKIIVTEGRIWTGGNEEAEHLFRALLYFQIPSRQAEVDEQLRIFGVEFDSALICHQRL